jgi:hypothetical protein
MEVPDLLVGTLVVVWRDNGQAFLTRTRSDPFNTGGGWVVKVEGISGYYALERVRPVSAHQSLMIVGVSGEVRTPKTPV